MRDNAQRNACAPDMSFALSAEAERQVARNVAEHRMHPGACHDEDVIRRVADDLDAQSALRPAFVRDAEKIMHMPAYNRLSGKTQVFSLRSHDDLTRRGLHVQLVARIARDIGRALGLNCELIDAIALGHDIGHTPFGHAGERFLDEALCRRTGRRFFHNVHSVRVLDVLYGRNLSLQTLDGVICHNGEFEQQRFEVSDLADFVTFDQVVEDCWQCGNDAISHLRPMTLEGCVVRISDIIAYVGKDRQDAIRAGLLDENAFDDGLGGGYNAWALAAFAVDVVEASLGSPTIQMSEAGFAELRRAKRENYQKIYGSAEVEADLSGGVRELFEALFARCLEDLAAGNEDAAIFRHHVRPLERHLAHYGRAYAWQDTPEQTVCDFIASMTDDYFVNLCEDLFPEAVDVFPHHGYFA